MIEMLKEYKAIQLKKLETQSVGKLGKLARLLLEETVDKEKVLAEMDFQRVVMDVCQLCLCYS